MAAGVLDQCPICRARLDGAGPCRRCRAELGAIRRIANESAALAGAGLHRLAAGDRAAALRLIRRARVLRAAPDLAWILSALGGGEGPAGVAIPMRSKGVALTVGELSCDRQPDAWTDITFERPET
jgi:hypothetical protein